MGLGARAVMWRRARQCEYVCVPGMREQESYRDEGLRMGLQIHPVGEGWAGSGPPSSAVCPPASGCHLNFGLGARRAG